MLRTLLAGLLALALVGCSAAQLESSGYTPPTEEEVSQALRDALGRGITRSIAYASQTNGFYGDARLRIELPEDADQLVETLRKIGFGKQVERAEKQLNRAAEAAAARAKPIFIKSITAMSIDDAFAILYGEKDAATQYLSDNSRDDLVDAFLPIIEEALDETSATRYYSDIVERYNDLPLTFDVDPDLADYVTQKAIDGLFVLMADEEAQIREYAAARSTRLMRRVFGSLD